MVTSRLPFWSLLAHPNSQQHTGAVSDQSMCISGAVTQDQHTSTGVSQESEESFLKKATVESSKALRVWEMERPKKAFPTQFLFFF